MSSVSSSGDLSNSSSIGMPIDMYKKHSSPTSPGNSLCRVSGIRQPTCHIHFGAKNNKHPPKLSYKKIWGLYLWGGVPMSTIFLAHIYYSFPDLIVDNPAVSWLTLPHSVAVTSFTSYHAYGSTFNIPTLVVRSCRYRVVGTEGLGARGTQDQT